VELATARDVPCAGPHLFEAVSRTNIASAYPVKSRYPTEDEWTAIADRYCGPLNQSFLGYQVDPNGRFANGAIRPVRDGWAAGDRELACGLIARGDVGSDPDKLPVFTGKVEGADQAWVFSAGTCLKMTESETKGSIPCASPHQAESVGAATLPDTPDGHAPTDTEQEALAEPRCTAAASRFLGRTFQPSATMQIGWLPIPPESWRAGTRTLTCTVEFFDSAGRRSAQSGELPRAPSGG
jgi:Septum formation